MKNNKIAYLFSSSYRERYRQDNINVLAHPPGFVMHFRYDRKWVDDKLLNDIDSLKGKEAIIVIVDSEKGNNGVFPKFYPVRKAKIIKAELSGSVLHVYFELLPDWVDYTERDYDSLINSLKERPKERKEYLSGKFIVMDQLVQPVKFSPRTEAWESIIKKISVLESYKRTLFFKLDAIREVSQNEELKIENIDKHMEILRGYVIKSGGRYALEISLYLENDLSVAEKDKIVVRTDEKFFYPLIPKEIPINFRVDKQILYISTKQVLFDSLTHLIIELEKKCLSGPEIIIPLKVKYNRIRFGLSFLIFFAGLMFTGGVIPLTGIASIIIKVIGSLMSTGTIAWLYRKIG
ncbi:MAG: hypothetical protein KBONHNOK_01092 [Candidatus Methanoperedenaceae archaeon GB50]|nr:MAG: hypothetical protein KBONHNOK_01092 [Candidatus Methanoperedenaceae archaeon GB50]